MKLCWIFIVAAVTCVYCQTEPRRTYCGERLFEALSLVCKGEYAVAKKDGSNNYYYYDGMPVGDFNNDDERDAKWLVYPWIRFNNVIPAKMMDSYRRTRRGVVDECCYKPCTFTEMRSFCK